MGRYIKINGTDFTDYFLPYTPYAVTYKHITGTNSGTMLSGKHYSDEIRINSILTLPCRPLTDAEAEHLLYTLFRKEYADVEYFEPRIGAYRTMSAMRTVSGTEYWGGLVGGDFNGGLVIKLEERGDG